MRQHERNEQIQVFKWSALMVRKYPELELLYASANGGSRNVIEAGNLKRSGVKRGMPDINLPVSKQGYHGLWIEMKHGKHKQTVEQERIMELLNEYGHACHICYNSGEAIDVISWYLGIK